jgi:hypothetical protein
LPEIVVSFGERCNEGKGRGGKSEGTERKGKTGGRRRPKTKFKENFNRERKGFLFFGVFFIFYFLCYAAPQPWMLLYYRVFV